MISGIEQGYINQRPCLKEIKKITNGYGWNVSYKYGFWARWWRWVKYYDCEYELTVNYDDSRNYTA